MRVAGTPLWLDAGSAKDLSFVSHAHLDHVARHKTMIATAPTARFCRDRVGVKDVLMAPFSQPFELGDLSIELLPAGHILGSAQIRVTLPSARGGATAGYTGDFSLAPSVTVEAAAPLVCDVLVIEATFGLPRYAFPPKEKVMADIDAFIDRTRREGGTPVFLAYPLGKSQELAARLGAAGHRVRAHKTVWENCKAYEEFGVTFPNLHKFTDGMRHDEVLIFPHRAKGSRALEKVKTPRFAAVTGWAMDPGAKYRMKVDEAFPLSDHADFEGLLAHVKNSRASKVYVVHGFVQEFVRALASRGVDAAPLKPMERQQLELF
ncbi:MAG: MBL fold metallo-hydrolase [Deltaproteobacteria bacterium]|nr:MBL fold metallo-hydrolase [Deltaproteobacteria bacterium]